MDIRVANAYSAYGVYNTKNTPGAKKAESAHKNEPSKDEFLLSNQAGDYQTIRKALANVPDVRTDRINQVKAKMASGTYNISASDVASKILQGWEN